MYPPYESSAALALEMRDASDADWVDESLVPFGAGSEGLLVGQIVPTGFAAYARLLHLPDRPEGTLPDQTRAPLVAILERHTTTGETCLFCLWDGFGVGVPLVLAKPGWRGRVQRLTMRRDARRRSRRARAAMDAIPRVRIHPSPAGDGAYREYVLFRGAVGAVTAFGHGLSPNLWWPEDRAWVAATEIDASSTYVGGSEGLVREILNSDGLESEPSDPQDLFESPPPPTSR